MAHSYGECSVRVRISASAKRNGPFVQGNAPFVFGIVRSQKEMVRPYGEWFVRMRNSASAKKNGHSHRSASFSFQSILFIFQSLIHIIDTLDPIAYVG